MKVFPPFLFLVVMACEGEKVDADGDGIRAPLDCNDGDAKIFPGADETCDGLDNDCDGSADDGLTVRYWPDLDGDGAGDGAAPAVESCEPVQGHVADNGDCDDANAGVNPAAVERCDEIDQNCDGDAYAGATDLRTWYRDFDGDAFGTDDITLVQCDPPAGGYVLDGGDCDDGDISIYPGAAETCDGIDQDCDSVPDNNPTDGLTLYEDADGDGYGNPAVSQVGCPAPGWEDNALDCDDTDALVTTGPTLYQDNDGDGYGSVLAYACAPGPGLAEADGDCDDTVDTIYPGAPEFCDGLDQDCDTELDNDPVDGAWHPDNDGDGYGSAALSSCTALPDYLTDASDCDDAHATAYPGAPELCDGGIDNDCDPTTTDDDSADALTWYPDNDGDNHGVPGLTVVSCLQPTGYAPVDDDCDDAVGTTYPGANELCDGGIDNDCDPTTDEQFTAVWYRDADGDGYGTEQFTANGCEPPPGYTQVPGDCDDADPTLNPTLTPNCIQDHCGTISLSQTWKNTVEHTVSCDVIVEGAAKPTLTIQDGAIVRFAPNTELRVGKQNEGKLVVQGNTNGVIFTSGAPFPAPGDWDGLTLGARDLGSIVTGLLVEFAGRNGKGGIVVEGGNPIFDGLTSQWNLGDGLHITGSEPRVTNSALVFNTDNGLYIGVGAGLARAAAGGGQGPSFENNVITDNAGLPITIPGSHADEIALSNVLSPNDIEEIELLSGVLRFTGTWYDHGLPYRVANGAQIDVEDGPQAVLTVEDGVEVYFGISAGLTIGDGAAGRLLLEDGPEGIVFSATDEVIATSSNWDGVMFGADDLSSVVQNLLIEYGGGNGKGNLYIKDSEPLIANIVSQLSDSSGIYVEGATAAPEIRDCLIVDNDESGVYVASTSGIARSVLGPTFANNQLYGNGESSVVMPPNFVGELDPSTQFSGNGQRVLIHGGRVLRDALWRKLDEDYEIIGDVQVAGPQDPVLEIEDRVTLYFRRDAALEAGTIDDGALYIVASNGVLMTSADAAPGPGDWEGIEIGRNGALRQQTYLDGVTIEYAGGSDVQPGGAVEVLDRDLCSSKEPMVDLNNLTILDSSKAGVFAESQTTYRAEGVTISGALDGCWQHLIPIGCPTVDVVEFTANDCLNGAIFGTWPIARTSRLDSTSTYPGPVVIAETSLTSDSTMPALPVPYQFTALLKIADDSSPTLTIESGAVLEFGLNAGIEAGAGKAGGVVADGVTFTSAQPNPAQGDWEGLRFGQYCGDVALSNSTIEWGGGNNMGAIWSDRCGAGSVSDTTISGSSSCGVYLLPNNLGDALSLSNITYSNNAGGNLCQP